jgi:CBS domain containing-hemolysin-like protein
VFLLLAGEFAVKAFAVRRKVGVARSAAPLFKIFLGLLRPLSGAILRLVRFLGWKYGSGGQEFAMEMNRMLDRALQHDNHAAAGNEVARGIVNFNSFLVKDLMQHRKDISAVPVTASFSQLIDYINASGLSRIPVYRDTLDKIEGVVYTKDFLPFIDQQEDFAWQKLLRPALFIDEDVKIIALLKDFQQKHVHIALVVDKSGRITGLITLQDLIEEVMGNINKDYDPVPPKP